MTRRGRSQEDAGMMYRIKSIRAGALVAFLFLSALAFPANIVVPSME